MDLSQPVLVTQEGLQRLKHDLEETRRRRGEVAERLREASQPGDIEDNPEYEQAKEELGRVDDRLYELEEMIGRSQIIEENHKPVAGPGSTLEVEDADGEITVYQLVGGVEADPTTGKISLDSPIGRALVGTRRGDQVTVEVPAGTVELEVKAVH
ncbi:MAG TPA: transcription elongation factor GreA [Candidatus Binatia bacterium]|nr:transcription elongation factor GreA [Candidatus Binatia bacterium]